MTNALNTVPRYNCAACSDERGWPIHHASTDALIGWVDCKECPKIPTYTKWQTQAHLVGLDRQFAIWKKTPEELAAEYAIPF